MEETPLFGCDTSSLHPVPDVVNMTEPVTSSHPDTHQPGQTGSPRGGWGLQGVGGPHGGRTVAPPASSAQLLCRRQLDGSPDGSPDRSLITLSRH